MARNDPLRNFRFVLEIDGINQAGFSEVSGFDITVEPIDYREGNEETRVRKLPGMTKYGNVTLKWGLTDSMELYDWTADLVGGTVERKNVTIIVRDETGADKARWELEGCLPTKFDPSDLNSKGNEVAIDTLELVNEGIRRVA